MATRERKVALDVIEYAIKAVDPYKAVKKMIYVENERARHKIDRRRPEL